MHTTDDGQPTETKRERRSLRFAILTLISSLLVLGIGVQGYLNQERLDRADDQRAEQVRCIEKWADSLIDTITTRVDATDSVAAAKDDRDKALAHIIAVVIDARQVPPRATDQDFTQALNRYAEANAHLDDVIHDAGKTRNANPYPELVLDCEE